MALSTMRGGIVWRKRREARAKSGKNERDRMRVCLGREMVCGAKDASKRSDAGNEDAVT